MWFYETECLNRIGTCWALSPKNVTTFYYHPPWTPWNQYRKIFSSSISSSNHIKFATVLKCVWISWILSRKRQNWTSITLTEQVFRTHVLAGLYASTVVSLQWEKVCINSIWNSSGKLLISLEKKLNNLQPMIVLAEDTQCALGSPRWGCIPQLMKFPSYSTVVLPHSAKYK